MLVGRRKEITILNEALNDDRSRFIAIYGRRRIGKTFLIRETFSNRFTFQHSGLSDGGLKEQLYAFSSSLKDAGLENKRVPRHWLEAFDHVKDLVRSSKERRKIIFLDELSWMDTPKSDFMVALENFWNGFASSRKDVVLVVCASATSWMISKVIHNKGGLYNRLTDQIRLRDFTLSECEEYVRQAGLSLNRNQILQYYMVFGGVPFYWSLIKKGMSVPQIVDSVLFEKDAPLKDEYQYLYASVFKNPEKYIKIIETLAQKKSGLTRGELANGAGIANSGDLTVRLEELESCGFIRSYQAFGKKKKNTVFQLIDHFTLFHYSFMDGKRTDSHFFSNQINTPTLNTWMGLAFERVSMEHVDQIKKKLGISGVLSEVNSYSCRKDEEKGLFGSRIDMLIIRKDGVINLCEVKYSASDYMMTSKMSEAIARKVHDLSNTIGKKYAIYPTLITTYGLVPNDSGQIIQQVITLDDLFE